MKTSQHRKPGLIHILEKGSLPTANTVTSKQLCITLSHTFTTSD